MRPNNLVPGQDLSYLLMKKPEPKPAPEKSNMGNVLDTEEMAKGQVNEWGLNLSRYKRNEMVEELASLIDKAIALNNIMIADGIEKEAVAVIRTNFGGVIPPDASVDTYKSLAFDDSKGNLWPTARAFFRVANFIRGLVAPAEKKEV